MNFEFEPTNNKNTLYKYIKQLGNPDGKKYRERKTFTWEYVQQLIARQNPEPVPEPEPVEVEPVPEPEPEPVETPETKEVEDENLEKDISENIAVMQKTEVAQEYFYLYASAKSNGRSLEENVDLKQVDGTIFRDEKTGKFIYIENLIDAGNWFYSQDKPVIHSVINKYKPVRFNLELDIGKKELANIKFTEDVIKKMQDAGLTNFNRVKYLLAVDKIKKAIVAVLRESYNYEDECCFMEATHNRLKGDYYKYSHRFYMRLAFANLREYKHFCKLLMSKVRDELVPMIDPTSLMLRVPQTWKDGTRCEWKNSECGILDAVLTNVSDCKMLPPVAPVKEVSEVQEWTGDMAGKCRQIIDTHKDLQAFYTKGVFKGNIIRLHRVSASHCPLCDREHGTDSTGDNAYCYVAHGHFYYGCYRWDKIKGDSKKKIYLGYVGEDKPMDIPNWGELKNSIKKLALKESLTAEEIKEQEGVRDDLITKSKQNTEEFKKLHPWVYTDFKHIHGKTFVDNSAVLEYIKNCIVRISQGGNSFYISKDVWKKSVHYTELKQTPFRGLENEITYDIINPNFDHKAPPSKTNSITLNQDLGKVMMDLHKKNFYKTINFTPYLEEECIRKDPDIFNLFEGFRFKYEKHEYKEHIVDGVNIPQPPPKIKCLIDHIINQICSGDRKLARTFIQWMAHIIQKPTEKSYCFLIHGKQGSGKSIIYEILRKCMGEDLAIQMTKLSDLTQTHNKIVRGRMLINCNEATNYPTEKDVNVLKGFITDKAILINPKCCPLYYIDNYARLLITTNCRFAMRLTPDDRRYCCITTKNDMAGNTEYFKPLWDGLEDEDFLKEFFLYLANFDISDFDHTKPPGTKFKREMLKAQLPDIVEFMQDLGEDAITGLEFKAEYADERIISITDLYPYYRHWADYCGNKTMKRSDFKNALAEHFDLVNKRHRVGERRDNVRKRGIKLNKTELEAKFKKLFNNDEYVF